MSKQYKLPNDKLMCEFCNKQYTRAHRSQHRKSKICQAFQQAGTVIREAILNNVGGKKTFRDLICEPYTDKNGKIIYLTKKQFDFSHRLGKIITLDKEHISKLDQKHNHKLSEPNLKQYQINN